MNKQTALAFVFGFVIAAALIFTLQEPSITRASNPQAKPTPTVSGRMNAKYLEGHRAKDFLTTTTRGVAKAEASFSCGKEGSAIGRWWDNVTGEAPQVFNGNNIGQCIFGFTFPLEDIDIFVDALAPEPDVAIASEMWRSADAIGIMRYEITSNGTFVPWNGSVQVIAY